MTDGEAESSKPFGTKVPDIGLGDIGFGVCPAGFWNDLALYFHPFWNGNLLLWHCMVEVCNLLFGISGVMVKSVLHCQQDFH